MGGYVGGKVYILDTDKLEEVMRCRNGTMVPAHRGQNVVRVCLTATDEYEHLVITIPGDYLAKGGYAEETADAACPAHRRGPQLPAPTRDSAGSCR